MKKIAWVLLLPILMSAWLSAQNITVTSPKAGETWTLNTSKVISWTYSGIPATTLVKLVLFKGDTKIGNIIQNVSIKTGSCNWKVGDYLGGTAVAGSGYTIRIRDMDGKYPFQTSGLFNLEKIAASQNIISANTAAANFQLLNSIKVTSPTQGQKLKPGDMVFIQWDKAPIANYPQVMFGVYAPDRTTYIGPVHKTDAGPKPNTGNYQDAYILYDRYEIGKQYVIRVATPDDKFTGFSGVFEVIPLETVQETKTFPGHSESHYQNRTDKRFGCSNFWGTGRTPLPQGFEQYYQVGWDNKYSTAAMGCWAYSGNVYRTLVQWFGYEDLNWGGELVKAELHLSPIEGRKQTLSILRRDSESGDVIEGPATLLANLDNWVLGQNLVIDVTPTVKAWDKDLTSMHGFIVRGGNEGFNHDNANGICLISSPRLVITRSVKK